MYKIKHPHSYSHKQEHLKFSEKIHELKTAAAGEPHEKANELIKLLVNWVLHHVVVEDRKIIHPG